MDHTDHGPDRAEGTSSTGPTGDAVDAVVDQVRQDLADRRAAGVLPHLPAGELDRQFSAVIEAVDAGLVEEPPLDAGNLATLAGLEPVQPPAGGLQGRLTRPIVPLVGELVQGQVVGFSHKVTELIELLVHRQNRMHTFLTRTHLDRLRGLEYRVAELEREVEVLRGGPSTAQSVTEREPDDKGR